MADPSLPLLFTAAELFGMGVEDAMSGGGPTPKSDGRWRFPMPAWRGYLPTRSQEYRAADHHGLDVMYRRAGGADQMWPSGVRGTGELAKNNGTAKWFVPDGIPCCAVRDGTIWTVAKTSRGWAVVIDHGKPFATFYTHLSSVLFPPTQRASGARRVVAGEPIGIVGWDPSDHRKLLHLHMEIWYRGGAAYHIDPWPLLERAPLPELANKQPGMKP